MGNLRVTIKKATLEELERLLKDGDSVAALEVVREALDQDRQQKLRMCKEYAYKGYRQGRWDHKTYKELSNYAESFLR